MTDKELLELAAKAEGRNLADYEWEHDCFWFLMDDGTDWWNPLTDDGDALRLAVKLAMRDPWVIRVQETSDLTESS